MPGPPGQLRWAGLVRFLHGRGQTIVTHLATGAFVKIRAEAHAAVDAALAAGVDPTAHDTAVGAGVDGLPGLLATLRAKGFVVGPGDPEQPGDEPASARYARTPRLAYFAVTDRCNLACSFCYADARRRPGRYTGDTARSLRIVGRLADLGVVNLILSGGEPMLREDLCEIARAGKRRGMLVGLTTNGTLIFEEEAARLRAAGVDYVQVSVESHEASEHDALRGPGTHARCLEALQLLRAQGYQRHQLYVTATTTRRNLAGLQGLHELADRLGATPGTSFFQPVGRGGRHRAALACSEEQLLGFVRCRMRAQRAALASLCADPPPGQVADTLVPRVVNCCGMGVKTLGVKEDGALVPCHLFFSSEDFALGNVLDDGILERLSAYAEGLPTVDDVEGCRDCEVRYFCGNGCWAHVHAVSGTLHGRNPYCGFYKRYFSAVVWNLGAPDAMERIARELDGGPAA